MQENTAEKLEDKIYQMLTDQIGQSWPVVWAKFVEAVKGKAANAAIRDAICRHVVVNVRVETGYGKSNYYDKNLELWHKYPLVFGQMFVDPYSMKLSMVGYSAPVSHLQVVPKANNLEEAPKSHRLKRVSDRNFLCKCFDGKWDLIKYMASPRMWHFKEPNRNFGHVDFLKRAGMDSLGGYTREILSPRRLGEMGLWND